MMESGEIRKRDTKEEAGRGRRDGNQRGRREGGKIRFNRSQEH